MKKFFQTIILLLFVLCFYSCTFIGENKQIDYKKINNDITVYFREFYNDNAHYTKKTSDIFGLSSEGGIAEAYFKNNKLKRIALLLFGEMGKYEYNFFTISDDIIYVILTNYEYDKIIYENPNVKREYLEEYFIVNNEVMKYSIEKQNIIKLIDNDILTIYETVKAKF